ncbi:MAG: hypothetical protein PWQ10_549 [Patescibacteria group bacterium]|nr:hypothetical protein [Patescibacteria group bacterium]
MAKVITEDIDQQTSIPPYSVWKITLAGVALGIFYWILVSILNLFINSIDISGNVATILVFTVGVIVMLRLRAPRPLVVALATGLSLWGLASWTDGLFWVEIILCNILLYGLAYVLFSWMSRYDKIFPVLATTTAIVIIARIVSAL